jgi:hypothetical protein
MNTYNLESGDYDVFWGTKESPKKKYSLDSW